MGSIHPFCPRHAPERPLDDLGAMPPASSPPSTEQPATDELTQLLHHLERGSTHQCLRACVSDECRQGRIPCPTPEACWLPEAEDCTGQGAGVLLWPAVSAALVALAGWIVFGAPA